MITQRLFALLFAAVIAAPVVSQRTWIVECSGGPHADFTDLPQAVAAARAGDTILLVTDSLFLSQSQCPGYAGYTAPVIDKPITIIGVGHPLSGVWNAFGGARGVFQISNIPAGTQVVLSHLSINVPAGLLNPQIGIIATNCAGDIIVEDTTIYGPNFGGAAIVSFTDCANVVFHDSHARLTGVALELVNSNLRMTYSLISHASPLPPPWPSFTQTAPGIRMTNSTATILSSTIQGSFEVNLWPPALWESRPAVMLDNSVLNIGPGGFVIGGVVVAGGAWNDSYRTFGSGIGTVNLDPRGSAPEIPAGINGPPPVTKYLHATLHEIVNGNAPMNFAVAGPPGGLALIVLGTLSQPTPTPFGTLWLDPLTAFPITWTALNATDGIYQSTVNIPSGVQAGFPFCLQSMTLSPSGEFALTIPSPLVVGWETGSPAY